MKLHTLKSSKAFSINFYQYSAVRTSGLKDVLNDPQLKLTQAKDVGWLSHLWQCLPSVLTSLEREATERHDAQARGLALFVKDFFFVVSVYFYLTFYHL